MIPCPPPVPMPPEDDESEFSGGEESATIPSSDGDSVLSDTQGSYQRYSEPSLASSAKASGSVHTNAIRSGESHSVPPEAWNPGFGRRAPEQGYWAVPAFGTSDGARLSGFGQRVLAPDSFHSHDQLRGAYSYTGNGTTPSWQPWSFQPNLPPPHPSWPMPAWSSTAYDSGPQYHQQPYHYQLPPAPLRSTARSSWHEPEMPEDSPTSRTSGQVQGSTSASVRGASDNPSSDAVDQIPDCSSTDSNPSGLAPESELREPSGPPGEPLDTDAVPFNAPRESALSQEITIRTQVFEQLANSLRVARESNGGIEF